MPSRPIRIPSTRKKKTPKEILYKSLRNTFAYTPGISITMTCGDVATLSKFRNVAILLDAGLPRDAASRDSHLRNVRFGVQSDPPNNRPNERLISFTINAETALAIFRQIPVFERPGRYLANDFRDICGIPPVESEEFVMSRQVYETKPDPQYPLTKATMSRISKKRCFPRPSCAFIRPTKFSEFANSTPLSKQRCVELPEHLRDIKLPDFINNLNPEPLELHRFGHVKVYASGSNISSIDRITIPDMDMQDKALFDRSCKLSPKGNKISSLGPNPLPKDLFYKRNFSTMEHLQRASSQIKEDAQEVVGQVRKNLADFCSRHIPRRESCVNFALLFFMFTMITSASIAVAPNIFAEATPGDIIYQDNILAREHEPQYVNAQGYPLVRKILITNSNNTNFGVTAAEAMKETCGNLDTLINHRFRSFTRLDISATNSMYLCLNDTELIADDMVSKNYLTILRNREAEITHNGNLLSTRKSGECRILPDFDNKFSDFQCLLARPNILGHPAYFPQPVGHRFAAGLSRPAHAYRMLPCSIDSDLKVPHLYNDQVASLLVEYMTVNNLPEVMTPFFYDKTCERPAYDFDVGRFPRNGQMMLCIAIPRGNWNGPIFEVISHVRIPFGPRIANFMHSGKPPNIPTDIPLPSRLSFLKAKRTDSVEPLRSFTLVYRLIDQQLYFDVLDPAINTIHKHSQNIPIVCEQRADVSVNYRKIRKILSSCHNEHKRATTIIQKIIQDHEYFFQFMNGIRTTSLPDMFPINANVRVNQTHIPLEKQEFNGTTNVTETLPIFQVERSRRSIDLDKLDYLNQLLPKDPTTAQLLARRDPDIDLWYRSSPQEPDPVDDFSAFGSDFDFLFEEEDFESADPFLDCQPPRSCTHDPSKILERLRRSPIKNIPWSELAFGGATAATITSTFSKSLPVLRQVAARGAQTSAHSLPAINRAVNAKVASAAVSHSSSAARSASSAASASTSTTSLSRASSAASLAGTTANLSRLQKLKRILQASTESLDNTLTRFKTPIKLTFGTSALAGFGYSVYHTVKTAKTPIVPDEYLDALRNLSSFNESLHNFRGQHDFVAVGEGVRDSIYLPPTMRDQSDTRSPDQKLADDLRIDDAIDRFLREFEPKTTPSSTPVRTKRSPADPLTDGLLGLRFPLQFPSASLLSPIFRILGNKAFDPLLPRILSTILDEHDTNSTTRIKRAPQPLLLPVLGVTLLEKIMTQTPAELRQTVDKFVNATAILFTQRPKRSVDEIDLNNSSPDPSVESDEIFEEDFLNDDSLDEGYTPPHKHDFDLTDRYSQEAVEAFCAHPDTCMFLENFLTLTGFTALSERSKRSSPYVDYFNMLNRYKKSLGLLHYLPLDAINNRDTVLGQQLRTAIDKKYGSKVTLKFKFDRMVALMSKLSKIFNYGFKFVKDAMVHSPKKRFILGVINMALNAAAMSSMLIQQANLQRQHQQTIQQINDISAILGSMHLTQNGVINEINMTNMALNEFINAFKTHQYDNQIDSYLSTVQRTITTLANVIESVSRDNMEAKRRITDIVQSAEQGRTSVHAITQSEIDDIKSSIKDKYNKDIVLNYNTPSSIDIDNGTITIQFVPLIDQTKAITYELKAIPTFVNKTKYAPLLLDTTIAVLTDRFYQVLDRSTFEKCQTKACFTSKPMRRLHEARCGPNILDDSPSKCDFIELPGTIPEFDTFGNVTFYSSPTNFSAAISCDNDTHRGFPLKKPVHLTQSGIFVLSHGCILEANIEKQAFRIHPHAPRPAPYVFEPETHQVATVDGSYPDFQRHEDATQFLSLPVSVQTPRLPFSNEEFLRHHNNTAQFFRPLTPLKKNGFHLDFYSVIMILGYFTVLIILLAVCFFSCCPCTKRRTRSRTPDNDNQTETESTGNPLLPEGPCPSAPPKSISTKSKNSSHVYESLLRQPVPVETNVLIITEKDSVLGAGPQKSSSSSDSTQSSQQKNKLTPSFSIASVLQANETSNLNPDVPPPLPPPIQRTPAIRHSSEDSDPKLTGGLIHEEERTPSRPNKKVKLDKVSPPKDKPSSSRSLFSRRKPGKKLSPLKVDRPKPSSSKANDSPPTHFALVTEQSALRPVNRTAPTSNVDVPKRVVFENPFHTDHPDEPTQLIGVPNPFYPGNADDSPLTDGSPPLSDKSAQTSNNCDGSCHDNANADSQVSTRSTVSSADNQFLVFPISSSSSNASNTSNQNKTK